MSLANTVCWTYVFCPETAFPKIRFPKNMCDVRFCHKIMGCSHVLLFYNDLRKTSPWLHKNRPFHAEIYGPKNECALNARRPAPEITKQQLCALKSRSATHGLAHLLEPPQSNPGAKRTGWE